MVCCIQHGLWTLIEEFCREATTKKEGNELILPHDVPCPRVELPYTYLMAWFALHYPAIIKSGEEPPEDAHFTHLHYLENHSRKRTTWQGSGR